MQVLKKPTSKSFPLSDHYTHTRMCQISLKSVNGNSLNRLQPLFATLKARIFPSRSNETTTEVAPSQQKKRSSKSIYKRRNNPIRNKTQEKKKSNSETPPP